MQNVRNLFKVKNLERGGKKLLKASGPEKNIFQIWERNKKRKLKRLGKNDNKKKEKVNTEKSEKEMEEIRKRSSLLPCRPQCPQTCKSW